MTLGRQLWLLIAFLLVTAFAGSLVFSSINIRNYVEDQLRLKNTDTANALALVLTHAEKDPALIETFLSTQFDMGHFQSISLRIAVGDDYVFDAQVGGAGRPVPEWFKSVLPLRSPRATARVMDGWQEFGQLVVVSGVEDAYVLLWTNVYRTALWLGFLLLVIAVAARFLVRSITKPLAAVVEQAEAIGNQRFLEAHEPDTEELRRLVKAMNRLAARIKKLFRAEREHIRALNFALEHDELTGLASRPVILQRMDSLLVSGSLDDRYTLLIVRVLDLAELNREFGRSKIDDFLQRVANLLVAEREHLLTQGITALPGRLNGGDFALLIEGAPAIIGRIELMLSQVDEASGDFAPMVIAADTFTPTEARSAVLTRVDHLLAQAELGWPEHSYKVSSPDEKRPAKPVDEMRRLLNQSFDDHSTATSFAKAVDPEGRELFNELHLLINDDGGAADPALLRPWIRRFALEDEYDRQLLLSALQLMPDIGGTLMIQLSHKAINNLSLLDTLRRGLSEQAVVAERLLVTVPETVATSQPEVFLSFVRFIAPLGVKVGLVDAGSAFVASDMLATAGLQFIILEAGFVADIADHREKELLVQRMCSMAHAVGTRIIASVDADEKSTSLAVRCGIDGFRDA
ncbi:MAG: EAL domain-containing protein [Marinobacter sp.]|nr:EAL domain-containing protein [Marinobacter sp.]